MQKDKLLIIFLAGVLIFIVCIPTRKKDDSSSDDSSIKSKLSGASKNEDGNNLQSYINEAEYKAQLEKELSSVLSSAYGIGNVKVMITLESGSESVVKEDTKVTNSTITEEDKQGGVRKTKESSEENTAIYENESSASSPYVVKEKMPAVAGVLVVAEGGDKSEVVQNISDAVKALFDVDAHKIKVMKMTK